MPNFLGKVKTALKKQLGGDMPPEAKQAYEAEKKKGLIEGAKKAGRREGRRRGESMGRGGGFSKGILKELTKGSRNILDADPWGMNIGGFDINKSGMLDPTSAGRKVNRTRKSRSRKVKKNGQTLTIVVKQQHTKKPKPKRGKSISEIFLT